MSFLCNSYLFQEPVQDEDDIIKFCEQTGLPVALDETLGNITENPLEMLAKFTHSGVAAVVSGIIFHDCSYWKEQRVSAA